MNIQERYSGKHNCRFNDGVLCEEKKACGTCGWNPEVDYIRKLRTRERRETDDYKSAAQEKA